MTAKQRDPLVLFLDDGFDSVPTYAALVEAGFTVERFNDHFTHNGRKREGVADPSVVEFCAEKGWLMVTVDYNMGFTHPEVLRGAEVGVLATANNNVQHTAWVQAIIKARAVIKRNHRNKKRPYFSKITRGGEISRCVEIAPDFTTRRNRPGEKIDRDIRGGSDAARRPIGGSLGATD